MPLITELNLGIVATLTKSGVDLSGAVKDVLRVSESLLMRSGTGAGLADLLYYDERTVNASSSEDLDIVGALSNQFGQTFSPARIKLFYVKAAAANVNNVVVGAASATQWAALLGTAGTMTLRPGAQTLTIAGSADATAYVCAAGSTDLLKVANSSSGSSVTYQIVLVGASA